MDCRGRMGRKGRNHSRQQPNNSCGSHNFSPCTSKPWSFLSGLYSFFIMTSLMALIYLMLEYHCNTCSAKCDMNSIKRNIEDITKNLSYIKKSYGDLESQISKLSTELPRLEGQIEVLEALANTLEARDFGWNPKTHLTLPNVDVYLAKPVDGKNVSCLCNHYPDIAVC